jgi:AbrB family looped-hinge helix DNA binding protein
MGMLEKLTTRLSTKGQVILPKALRDQLHWRPGTRLVVEQTEEGVLLREAPLFKPTTFEEVRGMLAYKGKPKTLEEMDAGVMAEARRRARD